MFAKHPPEALKNNDTRFWPFCHWKKVENLVILSHLFKFPILRYPDGYMHYASRIRYPDGYRIYKKAGLSGRTSGASQICLNRYQVPYCKQSVRFPFGTDLKTLLSFMYWLTHNCHTIKDWKWLFVYCTYVKYLFLVWFKKCT